MQNSSNKSTIILGVVSVVLIAILASLFYYFAVKNMSSGDDTISDHVALKVKKVEPKPEEKNETPVSNPTNVIAFAPPTQLPKIQKMGNCFSDSIAAPVKGAWRCTSQNSIYDPCFQIGASGLPAQPGFVFCPKNPLKDEAFLIKLTKPLPKASVTQNSQDNWAWFLKLADNTYCSPFTGTRPFYGQDRKVAYYACNSDNKDQQVVILGDLIKQAGQTWKANKAILTKTGTTWTINSTQQVDIDTVWQ